MIPRLLNLARLSNKYAFLYDFLLRVASQHYGLLSPCIIIVLGVVCARTSYFTNC